MKVPIYADIKEVKDKEQIILCKIELSDKLYCIDKKFFEKAHILYEHIDDSQNLFRKYGEIELTPEILEYIYKN